MKSSERDRVELGVAVATIALGIFAIAGSFSIPLGAGYDRIGPRFFPYVVAVGLLVSGSWLALGAWRRPVPPRRTSFIAIGLMGLALASSVLLLERAGFIPTATLLFWLVARAFDSRRRWRDAIVGASLATVVYFAATWGLGLHLPSGPF